MRKQLVITCALLGTATVAHASGNGSVIDVGQVFNDAIAPYINAAVSLLILAGVTWLSAKIKQKTGLDIDAGHRDALARALQSEASTLLAKGAVKMDGMKVDVKSDALAEAMNNMSKRVPDALAHFGLSPDEVAKRLVAAIPQTVAGAQIVANASQPKPMEGVVLAQQQPK